MLIWRSLKGVKFVWKLGLLIILVSSLSVGCAGKVPSPEIEKSYKLYEEILKNATAVPSAKEVSNQTIYVKPLLKDVSPLKRPLTVALYQENYENVFFFLSIQAGLSLIIDPSVKSEIPPEREKITLQMKSRPLEEVIKKVCEMLDLHYQIEGGVLKILPFEERIFNLGFIPVIKESKAALGGDVLGNIGQAGGGSAPVKGEFSINANLAMENLDVYSTIESNLGNLLSPKGTFSLDRLTGILYVKDKPSKIKAIEKLITELRNKYRKQIILDAQIVEIELNRGHNLGVDWLAITNFLLGQNRVSLDTLDLSLTTRTDQPSFALTISGQPNINLLLNLLKQYGELKVISNPKLRVLHSQPALLSVGTSHSYIKEFRRDVQTGQGTTATTTFTTQTSSVFEGILLGITPYISEEDEVFLHIVPIKSDLIDLRDVRFGGDYFVTLPKLTLREMTSIVKARPNDLIVIGGLILNREQNMERKIGVPIISELFKSSQHDGRKSELVILIRVLIS